MTFKVAIGLNIAVNTIIGMFVIKPSGLSLDVTNNIITPRALNTKPFPVVFKHTSRCDPNIGYTPTSGAMALIYVDHPYVTDKVVSKCINLVDAFIDPSKESDSDNPGSKVNFTDPIEEPAVVVEPSLKGKLQSLQAIIQQVRDILSLDNLNSEIVTNSNTEHLENLMGDLSIIIFIYSSIILYDCKRIKYFGLGEL